VTAIKDLCLITQHQFKLKIKYRYLKQIQGLDFWSVLQFSLVRSYQCLGYPEDIIPKRP